MLLFLLVLSFSHEKLSFIIAYIQYKSDYFRHIRHVIIPGLCVWLNEFHFWDSMFYWRHSLQIIITKKVIPRNMFCALWNILFPKQTGLVPHKLPVSSYPPSLVTHNGGNTCAALSPLMVHDILKNYYYMSSFLLFFLVFFLLLGGSFLCNDPTIARGTGTDRLLRTPNHIRVYIILLLALLIHYKR